MKRKISQHVLGLYFGLLLVKNIQEFWALFWATFSHIQEFWALFGLLLMANWAPKFLRTWQHCLGTTCAHVPVLHHKSTVSVGLVNSYLPLGNSSQLAAWKVVLKNICTLVCVPKICRIFSNGIFFYFFVCHFLLH